VIASELMEAGRALQRGLVTPERTTFIVSTHRVYSMTERTALGDGRVEAGKLLEGARAAAARLVAADFAMLAEQAAGPIAPVLFGALAACGALPFTRRQFEQAIERGGVGVKASLKAFDAGFQAAHQPAPAQAAAVTAASTVPLGPRLSGIAERITREFPPAAHETLCHAVLRLADYQDVAYAGEYLDRLQPLRDTGEVLVETARHLALWMSYEDAIRVADLKTRRTRFDRVAGEVRLAEDQVLAINEFMHPRVEEIADILPARMGRWLLQSRAARSVLKPFTSQGRVVRTSALGGFLQLYAIASLRALRRRSLRFAVERQRIDAWLAQVRRLAVIQPALALEVARAQRLVKGYGDTHARGWRNFHRILATLPRLEALPDGGVRLGQMAGAALADDSGQALERMLASV
jgi:indolepyruvate ferredoxin oxidoreductase beta subunit